MTRTSWEGAGYRGRRESGQDESDIEGEGKVKGTYREGAG